MVLLGPDYQYAYMDIWMEPNYMRFDLLYGFYSLIYYYTTVIHLKTSLYLRIVHYSFVIIYIGNVYYILKVIALVFKLDDYNSVYSPRSPYISPLHFLPFQLTVRFRDRDCYLPSFSAFKSVLMWQTLYLNLSRIIFFCLLSINPF